MNAKFDRLETCFPRSKRITAANTQEIQDWCSEKWISGCKAAEEDDHVVDQQGEIMQEVEDDA